MLIALSLQQKSKPRRRGEHDDRELDREDLEGTGPVAGGGARVTAGQRLSSPPDHCHNAEQPSCGKCARLARRPWKWEELDPAQQALFLAEAQDASSGHGGASGDGFGPVAWTVTDEDFMRQVVDVTLTLSLTLSFTLKP